MFCFWARKKIYNLLEGNLNPVQTKKIELHLQKCSLCAQEYQQMKQVLDLASQNKPAEPSSQFWANFEQELEERLTQERVLPQEIKLRPQYLPRLNLRPAFALATVSILLIAISFYLFGGLPTKGRIATLVEERLIHDIELLEEINGGFVILDEPDSLADELVLLEELS